MSIEPLPSTAADLPVLPEEADAALLERTAAARRLLAQHRPSPKTPATAPDFDDVLPLLRMEIELRLAAGLPPGLEEYEARFPALADALRRDFAGRPVEPPSRPTSAAFPRVPGYEIVRPIGRGGMGVVYEARDLALKRRVALKFLPSDAGVTPEQLVRFRAEAEAVGRLQHPNIVQIHQVGEHEGRPYLALEYVEGGSLDRFLAGRPLPAADAARLAEALARALHHAHERNIVHRDLKPANILLQIADCRLQIADFPEREHEREPMQSAICNLQSAIPKLTDFGLAKHLDQSDASTRTGVALGTPNYMAPEQATGRGDLMGPCTDVYGLGAVLYELLTSRPPFNEPTPLQTLHQVVHGEVTAPSRAQPGVPRDLEAICLKCLEKVPARRYGSAAELADDLGRYLRGEPTRARPIGTAGRVRRWARRRPAVAGLLAVSVGAIGALLGLWYGFTLDLQEQRRRADAGALDAQRLAVRLALRNGLSHCEQDDAARGLLWLGRGLELAEQLDGRDEGLAWVARANLAGWSRAIHALDDVRPAVAPLTAVAFAPDSRMFATGCKTNGQVQLWRTDAREPLGPPLGHSGRVNALAFAPNGAWLAVACEDGAVHLWSLPDRRPGPTLRHTGPARAVAFHTDGTRLLTGSEDGTARLWDRTGKPLLTLKHAFPVYAVAFGPDGGILTGGGERGEWGQAQVWDAGTGEPRTKAMEHENNQGSVRAVAFAPDNSSLATGALDGTVLLWSPETGVALRQQFRQPGAVRSVAYSPDSRHLAIGGGDHNVRIWDVETGRPVGPAMPHPARVDAVAISPDGRFFLTASSDPAVRLWRLAAGPVATFRHADSVRTVSFRPGSGEVELLTACRAGTAQRWSLGREKKGLGDPIAHSGRLASAVWRADGRTFATVEEGKSAWLWPSDGGAGVALVHPADVTASADAPDGRTFATACADGLVRLWGPAGELLRQVPVGKNPTVLEFRPDGGALVVGGLDMSGRLLVAEADFATSPPLLDGSPVVAARFWPDNSALVVATIDHRAHLLGPDGRPRLEPWRYPARVTTVAVHPNGEDFLTGTASGQVRLWSARTGEGVGSPMAHGRTITAASYHPAGRLVATASRDNEARLWCSRTGLPVGPPVRHSGAIDALAFSPTGRFMATGGNDGMCHVWEVPEPVAGESKSQKAWVELLTGLTLEGDVVRMLTPEEWRSRRERAE